MPGASAMILFFAVLLVASPLFVHEAGHWAVLRRQRVPVTQFWIGLGPVIFRWRKLHIGMFPIGCAVLPQPAMYQGLAPAQRMAVALAGPAASVLYGICLLLAQQSNPEVPGMVGLQMLAYMNFALAAINLIPVPPLDGFQAFVEWQSLKNTPLSPRLLEFANRVGSGLVYGVGFSVLLAFVLR